MSTPVMIEASHLTKYYGDFPAITDVSFSAQKGEILGFLGPNAAGKTTTMRILTGFMSPSSGTATIAGYDVVTESLEARRHVGYMPETVPLYTDMMVKDYLRFMGTIRGVEGKAIRRRINDVIQICRLEEYYKLGARFAKWRAVITIGDGIPSDYCIATNAHALARYAALCQEQDIVPIVEPEVLMDADNTLEVCEEVTDRTLHCVFNELHTQRVPLEGIILKPNMIVSGKKCAKQADRKAVAAATLRTPAGVDSTLES
jgi:hypothetical protein